MRKENGMKKQFFSLLAAAVMGVSLLSGCNSPDELAALTSDNNELKQMILELSEQVTELRAMYNSALGQSYWR